MALTTPPEAPDPDDVVEVPRSSLGQLRGLLVGVLVGGLIGIGTFIWSEIQQGRTNDHLRASDAAAAEDREALERLVERENREEDVESAVRCIRDHLRYAAFLDLAEGLTFAGARVGTDAHLRLMGATEEEFQRAHDEIDRLLPEQVQPLIDRYPGPQCDRVEAERTVQDAPPGMLDDALDG